MNTRPVYCNPNTYTKLTEATDFIIQNNGNGILQLVANDTQPIDTALGIQLNTNEAVTEDHLTGVIWGKGNCTAVVADDATV